MTDIHPAPSRITTRYPHALHAYLVLGPDDTDGRPVEQIVAQAVRGGVSIVQLRAKNADLADIVDMASRIADVLAEADTHIPLLIDDRVDAAWQCRAMGIAVDGVHIGQSDMDPRQARGLLGDEAIIGLSVETIDHVLAANTLPDGCVDYLGAGPLHMTSTKPDAAVVERDGTRHALGYDGVEQLANASRYPIVAGGGVQEDDLAALAHAGVDGWFVVSAIARAAHPEHAARQLVERWREVCQHPVNAEAIAVHEAAHATTQDQSAQDHATACPTPHNDTNTHTLAPVLTIAGSDSSGGAGIQADMKTMLANGVFAMSAITAITAQNTLGVTDVAVMDPAIVGAQIDAVFADIPPLAVKIGMVPSADAAQRIAQRLEHWHAANIVLDPVMVATSGAQLVDDDAMRAIRESLFPLAAVITPNIPEAQALCGMTIASDDDMVQAAHALTDTYGCATLVKGGHGTHDANDVLVEPDGSVTWMRAPRIDTTDTHGTGCTLSSAIAANLALGLPLSDAIRAAKRYLTGALQARLRLGHGSGPMDHAWQWRAPRFNHAAHRHADNHAANTVAAVAIAPSGVGDELSSYVSQVVSVIRNSGLPNETNAMFTNIEGDLDAVLAVVGDASHVLADQGYRTQVSLKLDIRPGFSNQLQAKPALVDRLLGNNAVM